MSYSKVPNAPPVYDEPAPAYAGSSSPYAETATRTAGDNIPDDFKYSVNVALCELPVRQMFIRKVYSLLSLQILATVVVGFFIRLNEPLKNWCLNNMWLYFVSIAGVFGFMIAAHFKAKSYPTNLICLAGFTLCEAYGVGLACSFVESDLVVQALLITFVIFIGLTAFAFQTKYDFTSWQGALGMAVWALIGWGFVTMFFPHQTKGMEMLYSGIGAIIFSGYIVVDTQIIMKTACLDDEVPATIKLYLDILNLFLFILRMLLNRDD